MSYQGHLAMMDGRLEEAVAIGDRVRELGQEWGMPAVGIGFEVSRVGRALVHLGRIQEFVTLRREMGASTFGLEAYHLLSLSEQEQAVEALTRLWIQSGIDQGDSGQLALQSATELLEAAVAMNDLQRTRALSHLLEDGPDFIVPGAAICLPRLLGEAAALLAETNEARTQYQRALEVCTRTRFRPEAALARLALADLLFKHYPNEEAEALEHLDVAIAELREMKMQPALERALSHRGLLKA